MSSAESETPVSGDDAARSKRGLDQAVDRLIEDARAVRAAVEGLDAGQRDAARADIVEVEDALTTMELDLQIARAALAVRVATTRGEMQGPVEEISSAVRRWMDEMTVQSRLGGMELGDRVGAVTERLERAASATRSVVGRLGDDLGVDLEELRRAALQALRDTRDAVGDAAAAIRRRPS